MKRWIPIVAAALTACSGAPKKSFCSGATTFDYDPASPGADLVAFPDDFFSVPDATTRTGLRLKVDATNAPWLQALPTIQTEVYDELNTLDGFGTSAGIVLRFSGKLGKIPSGEAGSVASKAIELVDLGSGGPTRVPFEALPTDGGAGIILWPLRPLRPMTPHAVVLTTAQHDAGGSCIAPSPAMRALLSNRDVPAPLASLAPKIASALKVLRLAPEDVSAAIVFTTESIFDDTLAVAKDIAARTFAWKERPSCEAPAGAWRHCEGLFTAGDYRKERVVSGSTPQTTYDLPVALWLPATPGPWPALIFGHGNGASREQAEVVADVMAPLGVATLAIDAPDQGDHPTAAAHGGGAGAMAAFYGLDPSTGGLNALVFRDHMREAAYDKLQLLKLLRDAPDLDGDGRADLDLTHPAYVGYSLGGMMASEFAANARGVGLMALFVPGGRISTIASQGDVLSILKEALASPEDPGSADRFFAVLQAVLDRGDPINWAPHLLRDRFDDGGAAAPNLFVGEVVDDATMPNAATAALARALGLPQLPPVIRPIDGVPPLGSAPAAGNLGGLTAALFQFDRLTLDQGAAPVPAAHGNILLGAESQVLLGHFVGSWLTSGKAELIDPYATLHTPPLGP